jgi:hypothetical protein
LEAERHNRQVFWTRWDRQINLYKNPYLIGLRGQLGSTNGALAGSPRTQDRAKGLSGEARELLREAAADRNGSILKAEYIGGTRIQTNGKLLGGR